MKENFKKLNPMRLSSRLMASLVCVFACLLILPAQAQDGESGDGSGESAASKLMVGPRIGVNYSKLIFSEGSGDGGLNTKNGRRAGFVGGAFVTYNFNQWIGAGAEVLFSQQAVRNVPFQLGSLYGVSDYRTDNIEVNLLADVKIPMISVYKPKFYIGPSFAFNMGAENTVESELFGYKVKETYNAIDQFAPFEIGVLVGTGLDFNLKFATLKTDVRYRRGINDINEKHFGLNENLNGRTIHSDAFSFQIGLGFHL